MFIKEQIQSLQRLINHLHPPSPSMTLAREVKPGVQWPRPHPRARPHVTLIFCLFVLALGVGER